MNGNNGATDTTKETQTIDTPQSYPSPVTLSPEQVQSNLAFLEELYPDHYRFLDITGLNGQPFRNPFTGDVNTESFQNVREQGSVVALIAEKIAGPLNLSAEAYNEVISGAIAHNALKRFEVFMKTAYPQLPLYSEDWISKLREVVVDEAKILTAEEFAHAVNMRNMMGHGSLKDFLVIQDGKVALNPDRQLSELIVHIASDMVGAQNQKIRGESYSPNIQISSFVERAAYADFPLAYPFLWKEGLALSSAQGVKEIKDVSAYTTSESEIAKTYYEWQSTAFELIAQYLVKKMYPENSGDAIHALMQLVNEPEVSGLIDAVKKEVNTGLPK